MDVIMAEASEMGKSLLEMANTLLALVWFLICAVFLGLFWIMAGWAALLGKQSPNED